MNKEKQLKVRYADLGLANFFGDYIEINKKLKDNKPLRDYIVKHELGHSNKFDLKHEFEIDWKIMPSLLWFVISTPKTWIDFFPIQIRKKAFIYDVNLLIIYSMIITAIISLSIIF